MVFFLASTRESWLLSGQRDSLPSSPPTPPTPTTTTTPSTTARISPAVLFIIIILAVIFFISGLLHLLVRFLVRKPAASGGSSPPPAGAAAGGPDALQRQLQQLFHLHDSGLDQAFIDALPVFLYREMVGPKEPFDCAVCLSEFARDDRLRLLPACGHAFHIACIDTWLLSNSTCPLCRAALFAPGLAIENPVFDLDDRGDPTDCEDGLPPLPARKPADEITEEKRLFPVKLGKFRRLSNEDDDSDHGNAVIGSAKGEKGETSSSKLDARRCYSMGSYQYVVGDAELRVPLSHGSMRFGDCKGGGRGRGLNGDLRASVVEEGRRIGATSRGESFSVSKIWLWSNKKGKFPVSSDASSLDGGLPWLRKSAADV